MNLTLIFRKFFDTACSLSKDFDTVCKECVPPSFWPKYDNDDKSNPETDTVILLLLNNFVRLREEAQPPAMWNWTTPQQK